MALTHSRGGCLVRRCFAWCLLAAGLLPAAARAKIYLAGSSLNQINIYPSNASGNTAPTVTIGGAATGLSQPEGVAVDANYIYVANYEGTTGNSVRIFALNASGNAAPVAVISGSNTGLANCQGIAVDANNIYVVNESAVGYASGSVTVYPKMTGGSVTNGNVAPISTIGGPDGAPMNNTGFAYPFGIAVDSNYIYVTIPNGGSGGFDGGAVSIFPLNASGNAVPAISLVGLAAFHGPIGVAVNSTNLYLTDENFTEITNTNGANILVFPLAGLNSSSVPSVIVAGSGTGLDGTDGVAVDANNIYVRNGSSDSLTTYPLSTPGGNVAPTATLSGDNTLISYGFFLAADATVFTHLVVSAPASASVGSPISVTVTAEDDYGTVVTGYSGTVQFTSTDGSASLPASTTLTNGTATFNVTFATGGTQTVTATDTVTSYINGASGPITVEGGTPTHFSVSAASSTVAGAPLTVTVTALNAGNTTATTYSGTVHFTSTDRAAVLPANSTLTNGTGTFQVTLKTTTFQSVTATDTVTPSLTGSTTTITVVAGAAVQLEVGAPTSATAGSAIFFTVTATDAYNNTASGYSGTVHFTSTDGSATLPADATLTSGSANFNATLKTAGAQTVTATDTVTPSITGTSRTIAVQAAAAARFVVTAPSSAIAGVPVSVTVTAVDAENNVATSYFGTVAFASTDGSATVPANSTLTNGTGTFNATFETAGSQTVTAVDTVTTSITGTSAAVAVGAGSATHFSVSAASSAVAGIPLTVTVTALTSANTTAATYAGTVHFTSTDGSATLPANGTLTNGTGTFQVTLKTAGSQTVTATDTVTSSLTGTTGTIAVQAGAATRFVVTAPASATGGTPVSITVTAVDPENNVARGYAGTVAFASTDGSATVPANSTLTNGTGTFNVTFETAGSQTVTAVDTVATSITGTSSSITVNAAAATHFSVSAASSAVAGVPFTVTVTALTSANTTAATYAGTVHFTSTDGSATLPANRTLTNGTGTFNVTFETAGSQTVTAVDTVATSITGTSGSVAVRPGAATRFVVTGPGSATAGVPASVTVTAFDGENNVATSYSGTVAFASTDGSATVPANSTLTNGTGTFNVTFETAGSQTVTAVDTVATSITGTSSSITVNAAAATHFSVSAASSAVAGVPFTVTVTALTSANTTAATYAGTVHFTSTDGSATLPANGTLTNGTGTFQVTLKTAGSQTVTATDTVTSSITGTSGSITVVPGAATRLVVAVPATAKAGTAISISVTALDSNNNTAASYAGTVLFASSDSKAVLPAGTTLTNGTGTFSATLNTAGNQTISALDASMPSISGTSAPIAVAASAVAPTITVEPASTTVSTGATAAFWVSATGTAPLTYQWSFNGAPIAGGTAAVLLVTNAQASNAGSYTVTVSNAGGSAMGTAATLTVTAGGGTPPHLLVEPSSETIAGGSTIVFSVLAGEVSVGDSVAARASPPGGITYQWFLNGVPLPGATNSTLVISNASAANNGAYTCLVTDSSGSLISAAATLDVTNTANPGRLINYSCLADVGTGADQLTVGYVVGGQGTSGTEAVLIRASGPALAPFGVTNFLADPKLTLNGAGGVIATNSGWAGSAQVAATAATVGAFAWTNDSSHDSALLEAQGAGNYSAQIAGASADTGVALAEVYDATPPGSYTAASPRLINISALSQVGAGSRVLIAGFVVGGTTSKTVLIRASGPALTAFGVAGTLPDPSLSLYQSAGGASTLLQSNAGWNGSAQIAATAASVGAFSWGASATADSALLVTLPPGVYTAQVSGASGDSGTALIEVYDVP